MRSASVIFSARHASLIFPGNGQRLPTSAPALAVGSGTLESTPLTMDMDAPANANGVLYALAGFSGSLTCYVNDGFLCREFNLFEVQRTKLKSKARLPTGKVSWKLNPS